MRSIILHYTGNLDGLGVVVYDDEDDARNRWPQERSPDRYGWLVTNTSSLIGKPFTVPEDEAEPKDCLTGTALAKVWNTFCHDDYKVVGRFTNRLSAAMRVSRLLLAKFGDEDTDTAAIRDAAAEVGATTAELNESMIDYTALGRECPEEHGEINIGEPSNTFEPPAPGELLTITAGSALHVGDVVTGLPSGSHVIVATSDDPPKPKRGYRFSENGVPVGAVLTSKFDAALTATVVGDGGRIAFEGAETTLSAAALAISQRKGKNWPAIQGPAYWLFDGKKLSDL